MVMTPVVSASQANSILSPLGIFKIFRTCFRTHHSLDRVLQDPIAYETNRRLCELFETNLLYVTIAHTILIGERSICLLKAYTNLVTTMDRLFEHPGRFIKLSKPESLFQKIERIVTPYFSLGDLALDLGFAGLRALDALNPTKEELGAEISFNMHTIIEEWDVIKNYLGGYDPTVIAEFVKVIFRLKVSKKKPAALKRKPIDTSVDVSWKKFVKAAKIRAEQSRKLCKVKI